MARLHQLAGSITQDTKIDPPPTIGSKTFDDASYRIEEEHPICSFLAIQCPAMPSPMHTTIINPHPTSDAPGRDRQATDPPLPPGGTSHQPITA